MTLDLFTSRRLLKFFATFKSDHGRDASTKDLEQEGFTAEQIKQAVHNGLLQKYQVSVGNGAVENRFKILKDWQSLNLK